MKTILYYCLTLLLCISVCNDAEAKKKKYPNGDVYEGEWKSGQPQGKGKMVYANGNIYEGDWKEGKHNGKGRMIYKTKDIYEGEWKDNQEEGYGKMIYANGNVYEGGWRAKQPKGKGKITYPNGDIYEGEWKNEKDSQGKMVYVNGTIYEGEWTNDQPNGQGKVTYANGGNYEGEWFMGEFFGRGEMTYPNGEIYEGEWKNNRKDGYGKMTYANGEIYEGEWKNDQPEGKGQIIYANGDKYECEWKNREIRLFLRSNINNISEFFGVKNENGTMTGEVKYSYANNNCSYTGDLRDYKRHGEGTFCFTPENCISGIWKSDSLVSGSGDFVISRISVHITKKTNHPFYFILNISGNDEAKLRKTIQLNKEFPIDQLYNIAFSEIEKFKENPDIAQLLHEAEEKEKWEKATNFNIILEKPNTILSHIPLNRLDQIDSLTVTGFLYEADVVVINKCKSLRYLDLSRTFITHSPQAKEYAKDEAKKEKEFWSFLFQVAGVAADIYCGTDDLFSKSVDVLLTESADDLEEADDHCFIPSGAFANMALLETVKLPFRAKSIERNAFKGCINLEKIELPPYLISISNDAFSGCSRLENIDFPSTLSSLGRGVFAKCKSLKKIDLSKSIFEGTFGRGTYDYLFSECDNLMELRLPNGITEMDYAYELKNCTIYFPSTLNEIEGTYQNCIIYFPIKLSEMYGTYQNCELHFSSPTPPLRVRSQSGNEIYIPKNCTTAYYVKFGEKNTYIEK